MYQENVFSALGGDVEIVAKTSGIVTPMEYTRNWNVCTFSMIEEPCPEEEDPTVLFKRNFLAQGQSFANVGSSGIGKSSMSVQQLYHWAAGRPFLADPVRPLRCAYIQTEDSPRDIAEQISGMRWGLMEHEGWSKEDVSDAEENIIISNDFLGLQGDDFIKVLNEFQHDLKFDVLMLNPLQGIFGGDLSDQEASSHFCRAGIDTIIKSKDCPAICGVVMHTAKQKSGAKDGRASVDDYAEYAMAGSQEWTAWCRAIFTFLKRGGDRRYIDMTCPKRGNRLDWDKKIFAQADGGHIYWREVTNVSEIGAVDIDIDKRKEIEGERKKNDQGEQANVSYLVSCCGQLYAESGSFYTNESLRRRARGRWTKSVADRAVKLFVGSLGMLGFETWNGCYVKKEWMMLDPEKFTLSN